MYNYTAFENFEMLEQGSLEKVALSVKKRLKSQKTASILIFSDLTGRQMDFDLSGTDKQVLERLKIYFPQEAPVSQGPGRPKLGVTAREISLLPRHWEWLSNQEGGASSVIRHLIEEKMKGAALNRTKILQDRTYKFLSAIAGNLPHFEEAIRFLFRKEKERFLEFTSSWPKDIVSHALVLAEDVLK